MKTIVSDKTCKYCQTRGHIYYDLDEEKVGCNACGRYVYVKANEPEPVKSSQPKIENPDSNDAKLKSPEHVLRYVRGPLYRETRRTHDRRYNRSEKGRERNNKANYRRSLWAKAARGLLKQEGKI